MKTWQRWQDAQTMLQKKREMEARLLWANKPDKLQQAKEEISEVGAEERQGLRALSSKKGPSELEVQVSCQALKPHRKPQKLLEGLLAVPPPVASSLSSQQAGAAARPRNGSGSASHAKPRLQNCLERGVGAAAPPRLPWDQRASSLHSGSPA